MKKGIIVSLVIIALIVGFAGGYFSQPLIQRSQTNTIDNITITKKLPENFLASINIGTPIEYVKEKFGNHNTYYVDGVAHLVYRFENLDIEIISKDEKWIDAIVLTLNSLEKQYPLYPLYESGSHNNFVLGRLKFKDLYRELDEFKMDISSKNCFIYTDEYFGNPGKYYHYRFANYMGVGCEFKRTTDWHHEGAKKLKGDFLNEIVNYVFITHNSKDLE